MDNERFMIGDDGKTVNNVNNANKATAWYGIFSPGISTQVFNDIFKATIESKKLNARFKRFGSEMEARQFSETGLCKSPYREARPLLQENTEKSPHRKRVMNRSSLAEDMAIGSKTFPSVPQRELSKLRIAIEKGNLDVVVRCMKENPRYLISAYDKPVTVQPGPHYNALHCAAKTGQKVVAETIMNYLISDVPWKRLYPNEDINNAAHRERRDIVIDGYFNTSDKGCGETPLHFSCKFGHLDFVQWLLTFNQVDITQRNKYDQTAVEVAGARCAEAEEIQHRVTTLIQESRHSVYVPVVRAVDNSTPPFLGQPVTPEYLYLCRGVSDTSKVVLKDVSYDDSVLSSDFLTPDSPQIRSTSLGRNSPLSPSLSICAYAGPMLMSEAKEFRKVWKTPPRELSLRRRDMLQGIMRSDSDRGLERVGRDLAVQQKVLWREYWSFLESFINLREEEGLAQLDRYLLENDNCFITGDRPSKLDQDVLHALPQGGVIQLADKFPNICNWYQKVLAFPEDERKCWSTPVVIRRKPPAPDTPKHTPTANPDLVRNLLSDLSLDSDDNSINNILVEGVSNLSVKESNKHFPPSIVQNDGLFGVEVDGVVPVSERVVDTTIPLPLASNWRLTSTPNETRQRYARSGPTLDNTDTATPRNRRRLYLSYQIMRWLGIFCAVWVLYFIYMHFSSYFLFLGDEEPL